MGRPAHSNSHVEEVQLAIIDATLKVFRLKGYRGISLSAIARELNWSPTALYRYFSSKDDLVAAVRAKGYIQVEHLLARSKANSTNPRDAVGQAMRDFLRFAVTNPELCRLMYDLHQSEVPASASAQQARERAFCVVRSLASDAVDAGIFQGDANLNAHICWASVHGLALLAVTGQLDLGCDFDDLVEPLIHRLSAPLADNSSNAVSEIASDTKVN